MFDEALLRSVVALRSLPLDLIFGAVWLLTVFNVGWFALAFIAARHGRRGRWIAIAILVAIVLEYAVVDLILKPAVGRPRPFVALPDVTPHLVPFLPATLSFPSGDVAASFAVAVAAGWQRPRWLAWLLGFGGLVAVERVYFGLHYPSDALGGALIGAAAGGLSVLLVRSLRSRLPWRAIVVPHTHWDREWYETVRGYRPRLLSVVDGVVAELEREGGVDRFTFDGQTIALEDYLGDRPAMRERVCNLIRADRLLIGPWYVLSDLILVHAESTIRNMQEGLRISGEHGRAMRVGYVADPFGHPAQMPQILRGFGYGSYVFARGLGDEGEELGAEFQWEAPSGDRVLAWHVAGHYDNALSLVRDFAAVDRPVADLRRRVRRQLPRILARCERLANTDVVLLMVGTDHTPITPELGAALAEARAIRPRLTMRLGTLEDAVKALPQTSQLPVHSQEMVSGRYRPILRGVNSTRIWIKQQNATAERLLLRWLEPFGALLGGIGPDELRPLWRTLLQCHPHDSICGCSIDEVHDVDMRERFEFVRQRGEAFRGQLLDRGFGPSLAWSPLPFAHSAVVGNAGGHRFLRFPGLGAVSLEGEPPATPVVAPSEGVIENGVLRVEVAEDGTFFMEGPGGRTGPHNVLVDEGDRGDEYTHSFAGPTVSSLGVRGSRTTSCDGIRGEVRVALTLEVPARLRPDRAARDDRTVGLAIETVVQLDAESDRVEVDTSVENVALDHRLRAVFASGRATRTHIAAEQFAWVQRPNRHVNGRGWAEQPPDTSHAQDFVAVADPVGGVAVVGDGLPEYGILAEGRQVAITLLRAVGYLSRGDLPERRGHAGPEIATPGAQVQGRCRARYCVIPLASDQELPRASRSAEAFQAPAIVAGRGEPRTLLRLEGDGAIALSALRASATEGHVVLRLVNPSNRAASARITFSASCQQVRATDLREGDDVLGNTGLAVVRTAAPLERDADGALEARLAPFEVGTWSLRLTGG
jgi:membrane-associated phospholipid phosphatase